MAGKAGDNQMTVMSRTQPTVISPDKRKTPCTTSSIVCFRFISAVHRNCTGGRDVLGSFCASGEVEELLRRIRELYTGLGDQDERTLDHIAAVLDGILGGRYAADLQCLDAVLDRCKRCIADGVRVAGNRGDDIARAGQLLTVLAGVLGVRDRLKAVARAAARLTAR